jgi:hypothetical protein
MEVTAGLAGTVTTVAAYGCGVVALAQPLDDATVVIDLENHPLVGQFSFPTSSRFTPVSIRKK